MHRLARLAAALAFVAAPNAQAQAPQPALLARLDTFADSLRRADAFSGVVLVAHDGAPVFHRAYGLADRAADRPNDTSTTFNVSSIGKLFTQAAVRQLAAQGKLSLDSTLGRYWPDYPNVDARRATVRQLLEHTSGVDGNIFQRYSTLRSNRDYLPLIVNQPLAFAPGTSRRYSNAGYVVLGEIVTRVSGEDYYDYVARHVFAPAGMSRTGYPAHQATSGDAARANSAIGYTKQTAGGDSTPDWHPNDDLQPARGSAAGGAYSTTGDLLRLVLARRAGRLGFAADEGRQAIAGGSPGSNGVVMEGLPQGYDIIVLANLDPSAAMRIADTFASWLGVDMRPAPSGPIASGAARTTTTLPDSPAGRGAAEYLAAFNSGDAARMRRFLETRTVPDQRSWDDRVAAYQRIFAEHGPLTLADVRSPDPLHVQMSVTSTKVGALEVLLAVEPDDAHRIAEVRFELRR